MIATHRLATAFDRRYPSMLTVDVPRLVPVTGPIRRRPLRPPEFYYEVLRLYGSMTRRELAAFYGVSISTIKLWIAEGRKQ